MKGEGGREWGDRELGDGWFEMGMRLGFVCEKYRVGLGLASFFFSFIQALYYVSTLRVISFFSSVSVLLLSILLLQGCYVSPT